MTYQQEGERVTLEMTREEHRELVVMLRIAAATALTEGDKEVAEEEVRVCACRAGVTEYLNAKPA
jgi:hypothetical protein